MKIRNQWSAAFAAIVLMVMGTVVSCKKDDPYPQYSVKITTNATLGDILTDSEGRTLYYFANDFTGASACTGACLTTWPVFHVDGGFTLSSSLSTADLAEITRADGKKQTTYKGWPLYYYATAGKNEDAGLTGGQGVDGIWFVAKANYAIMYANTQLIGVDGKHYKSDYTEGDQVTKYFTDDHGRTIYSFKNDRNNTNVFTNADYSNTTAWPLYYVDITNAAFSGALQKADFGTINVGTENRKQLTYKGWPLYFFGNDTNRGDNKGVAVPTPVTNWHIVNATTAVAPN